MNNIAAIILLILACVWTGCEGEKPPKAITPAVYHWKTAFDPTAEEKSFLKNNAIRQVYVKYFDIDLDNQRGKPTFKAILQPKQTPSQGLAVVPVVYITNRTLTHLEGRYVKALADKIYQKITAINQAWLQKKPATIQIDCDWTLQTKKKYFALLQVLHKKCPQLSATIRLHQIKFSERTGVPPVARGMLMCYNMGDWQLEKTPNSIFDPAIFQQYASRLDTYPLPLDVVMPAFYWTIVYRNHRFMYFINTLGSSDLRHLHAFRAEANRYIAQKDTSAWHLAIRKGDVFRVEEPSFEDIFHTSSYVKRKISNQNLTFALYHLDGKSLTIYTHAQIQQLYQPL